ncbi:hypothetical protein PHMEG_00040836 [Phytophthora megakarya]|uniref:Uncharacterized protein n=1 Tax=Phytophthora megakarya TaxID=4795 RepID=A0A225UCX6_9STRA|nr:hypothetical protein PHMEG_00040836 [Phytophthora megakarya]
MVQRYDKICGALLTLDHATVAKHGIAGFLLTPEETEATRTLLKSLHELNEVSKALQDSTLTLVGARRAFDAVLCKYPSMKTRLASDASVVNNPDLESGIVKIMSGGRLNAREQAACVTLKRGGDETVVEQHVSNSFLASAFRRTLVARTPPQHMPLDWPSETSPHRKAMDPNTLEVLMFLSYNKDWWDAFSVRAVRQSMRRELRE